MTKPYATQERQTFMSDEERADRRTALKLTNQAMTELKKVVDAGAKIEKIYPPLEREPHIFDGDFIKRVHHEQFRVHGVEHRVNEVEASLSDPSAGQTSKTTWGRYLNSSLGDFSANGLGNALCGGAEARISSLEDRVDLRGELNETSRAHLTQLRDGMDVVRKNLRQAQEMVAQHPSREARAYR